MSKELFADKSRLVTWDLSPNDRTAIADVINRLNRLESLIAKVIEHEADGYDVLASAAWDDVVAFMREQKS